MINEVFADTSCWIALVNKHDEHHERAHDTVARQRRYMVTTQFVFMELFDGAARRPRLKRMSMALVDKLIVDPTVVVVPATPGLFERALAPYSKRADKQWTLTDCASFAVMRERGIAQALTTDHHFEQAGFKALLRVRS